MADYFKIAQATYWTDAVITELRKHYSGLEVTTVKDQIRLQVDALDQQQRDNLKLDLEFKSRNPLLPLENLCSRIDNYEPRDQTQEEMLVYAKALIDLDVSGRAAGLFIQGDTGVGKTHIAVGVTKELMKKGQDVHYTDAAKLGYLHIDLAANQVWVLDDLNSPYGGGMDVFKRVVLNAHNKGGRVFVTSNTTYDELMRNGFVTDQGERPKFIDRTKGMFMVMQILGESARQANPWYAGIKITDEQRLRMDLAKALREENYERAAEIRDILGGIPSKKDMVKK